jgi:hypothetical protein
MKTTTFFRIAKRDLSDAAKTDVKPNSVAGIVLAAIPTKGIDRVELLEKLYADETLNADGKVKSAIYKAERAANDTEKATYLSGYFSYLSSAAKLIRAEEVRGETA